MVEEFVKQESSAPFNMALSTLMSLRGILENISRVDCDSSLPEELAQGVKLKLLKRFYVDSAPLLPKEVVEKYKKILDLKQKSVDIISSGVKRRGVKKIIFDENLEKNINENLILLQQELQEEKYYMPPRKDKGTAVGRFN